MRDAGEQRIAVGDLVSIEAGTLDVLVAEFAADSEAAGADIGLNPPDPAGRQGALMAFGVAGLQADVLARLDEGVDAFLDGVVAVAEPAGGKSCISFLPPGAYVPGQEVAVFGEIHPPFDGKGFAVVQGRREVAGAGQEAQASVNGIETGRALQRFAARGLEAQVGTGAGFQRYIDALKVEIAAVLLIDDLARRPPRDDRRPRLCPGRRRSSCRHRMHPERTRSRRAGRHRPLPGAGSG